MERAVEALNVVETRRTIEGLRDVLKNYPGITGYEILQTVSYTHLDVYKRQTEQ